MLFRSHAPAINRNQSDFGNAVVSRMRARRFDVEEDERVVEHYVVSDP